VQGEVDEAMRFGRESEYPAPEQALEAAVRLSWRSSMAHGDVDTGASRAERTLDHGARRTPRP